MSKTIIMSTHIHIRERIRKNTLNICFPQLSEEFPMDSKNELESFTVNEPSVFASLKLYRS